MPALRRPATAASSDASGLRVAEHIMRTADQQVAETGMIAQTKALAEKRSARFELIAAAVSACAASPRARIRSPNW